MVKGRPLPCKTRCQQRTRTMIKNDELVSFIQAQSAGLITFDPALDNGRIGEKERDRVQSVVCS